VSRLPEWFIGGPLHGKDKLTMYPNEPGPIHIVRPVVQRNPAEILFYDAPVTSATLEVERITYYPKTFMIFDMMLVCWVPESSAFGPFDLPDSETSTLLRELILAPHDREPAGSTGAPFDVSEVASAQRSRFELRREAQHVIAERYEAKLRHLEDTVASLNRQLRARTDGVAFIHYDANADGAAIQLEFKLPDEFGGAYSHIKIKKVVIYRYGTGEYVATAQPEDQSAVTGIGDDPKTALLGMICDALGYVGEFRKRSK
jgi:hypothetical protein